MSEAALSNPSPFGGQAEWKIPIYSDIVGAVDALGDGKLRFSDATSIVDLGLGILNTALDPLGALLGSAVGYLVDWLIECITPLKQAVDWLLGAPDQIAATGAIWRETGATIANQGNAFVDSLPQINSWEGPASEAYKGVVRNLHGVYQEANGAATGVAGWIGVAGVVVKLFRDFLLGLLKDFITKVVEAAIVAAISAPPTAGGSIGLFTGWFSAKIAVMAGKFSKTLSKLMTKMGDLVKKLGGSGRAFYVAAEKLRQAASRLGAVARGGFGPIDGGPSPRLPGNTTAEFNRHNPHYETVTDIYGHAKDGAEVVDAGLDGVTQPGVQDLPEGY